METDIDAQHIEPAAEGFPDVSSTCDYSGWDARHSNKWTGNMYLSHIREGRDGGPRFSISVESAPVSLCIELPLVSSNSIETAYLFFDCVH